MTMPRRLLPLLLAALALSGCIEPVGIASLPCVALGVGDSAGTAVVMGQVRAPANVLADGPTDDQPLAETPVPRADVYLADATGRALPGLPHATTDADGRYRIGNVPSQTTYVVVAGFSLKSGASATLETLAQAPAGTVTADLTLATTLVAADLVDVLDGFSTNLKQDNFNGAVEKTQKLLTNDRVPNLADPTDVLALAGTLLNVSPDLRTSVSQLKQDLATSSAPPLVE